MKVFEIGNSVRERMSLLDPLKHNYFDINFSLIMDFAPYREKIIFGKPMRSPEHRIIYVSEGNATLQIGFDSYEVTKGNIILIPCGSVIITEYISHNYNPYTVAFNIPKAESHILFPHSSTALKISCDEQTIITSYFLLIQQLVRKNTTHQHDVNFLVISMLHHINKLREETTQSIGKISSTRGKIICDQFLQLINSPQAPQRSVGWYANQLNITEVYLRYTIKAQTMLTPMKWINMATIREAHLLLVDSQYYSLSQIAEILHLSNDSQFIRFFKRETGETPNDFRKRMKLNY